MNSVSPSPSSSDQHQCVLDKQLCLSLNRHWSPLGLLTIRKAVVALCSECNGEKPAYALDIEMGVNDSGEDVLISAIPTPWEKWILLPVRPGDLCILTKNGSIRAPTVIVSAHYDKNPMKRPRLTSRAIFERDGGVCQYTGENVGKSGGNLDHVTPLDRGGKNTFENLVWSKREVNSRKGNRLNHEVGLTLLRTPKAPAAIPVSATIREAKHWTWKPFLIGSRN